VGAYNASKAGLESFGRTLQMELEGTGVRASIVRPGPTFTEMGWSWAPDMIDRCLKDWKRWGLQRHHQYLPAESIASAVVNVVTAPRGTHLSLVEVNPEGPIRESKEES
jgi:NAD(P)-dependent dehydrogenase (short-subunit alcohol dehydrogenase family)